MNKIQISPPLIIFSSKERNPTKEELTQFFGNYIGQFKANPADTYMDLPKIKLAFKNVAPLLFKKWLILIDEKNKADLLQFFEIQSGPVEELSAHLKMLNQSLFTLQEKIKILANDLGELQQKLIRLGH